MLIKTWKAVLAIAAALPIQIASPAAGLTAPTNAKSAPKANVDVDTYTIGPGDVLNLSFANSPELNQKVEVGENGDITVPLLTDPVHAVGITPLQLSKHVAAALENAKQLRNPSVNVYVEEHNSRFATILGQVAHPGVYPVTRRITLLELISLGGGLNTTAGATLTITHSPAPGSSESQPPTTVTLAQLSDIKHPSLNMTIAPGDVVNVSSAPLVYVVGAVAKPGGFLVQDAQSGTTILQALALAEGLSSTASPRRSLIIRRATADAPRQLIQIDIAKLMKGKLEDQALEANDIVFIPESQTKKNLQMMSRTAEASVAEIAGYGLGLRLSR